MAEIEDRLNFLDELKSLGTFSRNHEATIQQEIAKKFKELKLITTKQ
jgi:hypothetical protein